MKLLGPAVTKLKAVNQEFSKVYWKIHKRQTIARDKVIPVIDALALKVTSNTTKNAHQKTSLHHLNNIKIYCVHNRQQYTKQAHESAKLNHRTAGDHI